MPSLTAQNAFTARTLLVSLNAILLLSSLPLGAQAQAAQSGGAAEDKPNISEKVSVKSTDAGASVNADEKKQDTENQKPIFLWKCEKGPRTIFLLGTIHVARPDFYPLPMEIESALTNSNALFVEADALQVSKEKVLDTMKSKGLYTAPDTLSANLSAPTLEVLKQYLDWSGESLSMYQPYKPWVVSQLLSSTAIKKAGFKSELGIDRHLLEEAHASGKKIIPLESIGEQLGLMSNFDKATQDKILLGEMLTLKDTKTTIEKITACWKAGDATTLSKALDTGSKNDPGLEEARLALYDKRNLNMLQDIQKNLPQSGTVMVAVGAGHLVGKTGLIAKLEENGFSVQQLNTKIRKSNTVNFGGSNLKRFYYPEGLFRVMLPGEPEMKYETINNIRSVDYGYSTMGGAMTVSYMILPVKIPTVDRQKLFIKLIGNTITQKLKATEVSYTDAPQYGPAAMLLTCRLPGTVGITKQPLYLRSRLQLSGRRLYIVGGQGAADFLKSKLYGQFENSLEIIPEQGYAQAATPAANYSLGASNTRTGTGNGSHSGFSSKGGSSTSTFSSKSSTDWDKIRQESQQRSEELRRKVRLDFERTRQQLENSRGNFR